jgi:hypothetical protein
MIDSTDRKSDEVIGSRLPAPGIQAWNVAVARRESVIDIARIVTRINGPASNATPSFYNQKMVADDVVPTVDDVVVYEFQLLYTFQQTHGWLVFKRGTQSFAAEHEHGALEHACELARDMNARCFLADATGSIRRIDCSHYPSR